LEDCACSSAGAAAKASRNASRLSIPIF
jgi:hypothetical protein